MPDGLSVNLTATVARFESRLTRFRQHVETEGARVVEVQAQSVRQVVITTSPVDTGALQRSWSPVTARDNPWTWGFSTDLPYAPMLEYGGYRGVGPLTVALGGADLGAGFVAGAGIYSRQAPLGFVRRALADACPQFILRLSNMLHQGWDGTLGGGPSSPPPSGGTPVALVRAFIAQGMRNRAARLRRQRRQQGSL